MVSFLEITSGNQIGSRHRVEQGVQIGRSSGHIIIEDPKISGLHAQIEIDSKGQFVLVDLESSNGLIINGRRVKRVALLPGVSFEIGRTSCKIVEVEETQAEGYGRVVTWRAILHDALIEHHGRNESSDEIGKIFSPVLQLRFIQGIQTDTILTLGYGPRTFGATSLDIELLDPEAPGIAFEIHPHPSGAMLKNLSSQAITLNDQPVKMTALSEGDLIAVGTSLLKVSYI